MFRKITAARREKRFLTRRAAPRGTCLRLSSRKESLPAPLWGRGDRKSQFRGDYARPGKSVGVYPLPPEAGTIVPAFRSS